MFTLAKHRGKWTEEKIKRYIKEGRGNGIGKDYKPWVTIQSFPSEGRVSRIMGWKTERVHHLVSDNETRFFYLLEWSDIVTDIREQYPLIDYKETVAIADRLGIKHPADNESGVPYVLTTDFMITVIKNGKEINLARTIKPVADLEKERVIEKFEIERQYWKKRNIDWGIVTDRDIPKQFTRNIEWIHSSYLLEDSYKLTPKQLDIIATIIYEKIKNTDLSVIEIGDYIDSGMNFEKGTGLYIFKYLVSHKKILIDMANEINHNLPARNIVRLANY